MTVESPVLRIEVSSTSLRMELPMNETNSVSPLRQRMIEDMAARKLNPHTQRSHVYSCKRFAAWLKRSPDTATPDEVRRFQLYTHTTTQSKAGIDEFFHAAARAAESGTFPYSAELACECFYQE
jgi:integrase-like protein